MEENRREGKSVIWRKGKACREKGLKECEGNEAESMEEMEER